MEESTRYLIAGGGAAGMAAAHAIREIDQEGTITLLTDEADQPYFRPLIPFLVSGEKKDSDMFMAGSGPYKSGNVSVRTGSLITWFDPEQKTVYLENGGRIGYEKILFATGSRPYIPPDIEGLDADGVFALRTMADARSMAKRAEQTSHAVMLGGGVLNLKAAFALLKKGLKVTLIVYSPEVLSQLMEPEDAFLIRKALDQAGLKIINGRSAEIVLSGKNGVDAVGLDNGRELSCGMVCIGKGVSPNVHFLEGSGVIVDGGVAADMYTACNIKDAYTAGDVAVAYDPVSGDRMVTALWTNAVEMGRCAGKNMAGVKTKYSGTFGILNATQVADEPFVSMGTVHTKEGDFEVQRSSTAGSYRKMVFNAGGDRLIGAVLVGDITNAGLYRYVIREKKPVDRIKQNIIDHTLHYGHFV